MARRGTREPSVPRRREVLIADITLLIVIDFAKFNNISIQPDQKDLARWYQSVSSRPSASA